MDERYAKALEAMAVKAHQLGVQGVAVVMVKGVTDQVNFRPQFCVVGRRERQPEPAKRGPDDKGTSYVGVVWSKVAEMMSTGQDSGITGRVPLLGELGYRGGKVVLMDDLGYYSAFSGGTVEQDYAIAEAGMLLLLPELIG